MDITPSRVFVTGGAGFIGSHIVDALVDQGCQVTVLDNLSTGRMANIARHKNRILFIQGDIRDRQQLAQAMDGCRLIFHLAAMVSVAQSVEDPLASATINDIGTLNVLEAARAQKGARVVLSSSCAVYGTDPSLPKIETMPAKPLSPYAAHKLSGELNAAVYAQLYGLETVCLRYFNVYGPRQDPSSPYSGVISIFLTRAAKGHAPTIFGDGTQNRDFIFVKDVVSANLLAATAALSGPAVINVGTGHAISINRLWDTICTLSGRKITPIFKPPRTGDIQKSVASIDRAKTKLGFTPAYSVEKGLEITYQWYKTKTSDKQQ